MRSTTISRCGMTLFEVVLALAILTGSMTALASLVSTGSRAAVQTRLRTEAVILCQSKMSEVIAGIQPMQNVTGAIASPYSDEWVWSLQVQPGPLQDLLVLQVTVDHRSASGMSDATATLVRYLRNPAIFQAASAEEDSSESEE